MSLQAVNVILWAFLPSGGLSERGWEAHPSYYYPLGMFEEAVGMEKP